MLDFVTGAHKNFKHTSPRKPQHLPHPHVLTTYGTKFEYAADAELSSILGKEGKKFIQEVTVNFLYYAIAVDCKMITALGCISTQQYNPTENTMKKAKLFLDYAATPSDTIVTFRASGMILAVHSDTLYI